MKTNRWLKKSIVAQYLRIIIVFALVFIIGITAVEAYRVTIREQFTIENKRLVEKERR